MPELPEVETMVRGIRPHVTGRTLAGVRRVRCARKPICVVPEPARLGKRLAGQTMTAVRRLAKRVILDLSGGGSFAIEPRMTGLMLLSAPPTREHLRLEWRFAEPLPAASPAQEDYGSLWFWDRRGLGTVRYYEAGELDRLLQAKLGPDALDMTPQLWSERFGRTNRAVKVALLDQAVVAGIGNLYASEILHLARIAPARPARSLAADEVVRLSEATATVLTTAIRFEGSTLADGTYRNALNRDGSYQNQHRVYARAGQRCPTCGQAIVRSVQAGRSTFWCAGCQG